MNFKDTVYNKLFEETEEIKIAAIRYYSKNNAIIRLAKATYYDPDMCDLNIYGIPFMIFGEARKGIASTDTGEAINIEEFMNDYADRWIIELHAECESEILDTINLGRYKILKTEVLRKYNNIGIFAVKLYLKRKT